jgi:hypothetical protein
MANITMITEDMESLISRRMVLDLIEYEKDFFKNNDEKVEALRACADLWDHELVGDTKDLQEATSTFDYSKIK